MLAVTFELALSTRRAAQLASRSLLAEVFTVRSESGGSGRVFGVGFGVRHGYVVVVICTVPADVPSTCTLHASPEIGIGVPMRHSFPPGSAIFKVSDQ